MTQNQIDIEIANFKPNNYLCLNGIDYNTPIYRVFPVARLFELLDESKLTLVKTKKWEDPYENYLWKCNAVRENGQPVGIIHFQEQLFGQCWSLTSESDAMWRIYSHNKDGVRIRTTINKLFNVVFDNHSYHSLGSAFIGKVRYDSKLNIQNYFSQPQNTLPLIKDTTARLTIDAQLWKRNEFLHENEVRVFYYIDSKHLDKSFDIKKFDILPNDFIEEITFEPRITDIEFDDLKSIVQSKGFNGEINKSELYKLDPVVIRLT